MNVNVNEPLRVKCKSASSVDKQFHSIQRETKRSSRDVGVAQHTNLDEGFDLVEDHGLVREFNKGLGHRERERTQTRSEAANEDEGLHIKR